MSIWELLIIALGLSMDAFAVAICVGLTMRRVTIKKAAIVGLYFGIFQGAMPIAGFFLAKLFASKITSFDHWIAFALLMIIGAKMVFESFKHEGCSDRICPTDTCQDRTCPGGSKPENKETPLTPRQMLPLAIATSIDAMAVGITFAFFETNIWHAAGIITAITLTMSLIGVKIGNIFGKKFKSKAELIGGAVLILMAIKIVLEHLNIIKF